MHGSYEADFKINCHGDCRSTADGYYLKPEDAFKVIACPDKWALGARFYIDGVGEVTCHDRGGAIERGRLDLWVGIGDDAWIGKGSGKRKIYLIK